MIKEAMKEYYEKFKEPSPQPMCLGSKYRGEYEKLLKKAIQRGSPITEDELDEFLDDKEFDLVEDGEALEKNIKKGLK